MQKENAVKNSLFQPASSPILPDQFSGINLPLTLVDMGRNVKYNATMRAVIDPNLLPNVAAYERSLCRPRFRVHLLSKSNLASGIHNETLSVAGRGYTAFPLPIPC